MRDGRSEKGTGERGGMGPHPLPKEILHQFPLSILRLLHARGTGVGGSTAISQNRLMAVKTRIDDLIFYPRYVTVTTGILLYIVGSFS